MVHTHLTRALPEFTCNSKGNRSINSVRHSVFQTQTYYQSSCLARRCSGTGAKALTAALKSNIPTALEESTIKQLKTLDKIFNTAEDKYKETKIYAKTKQRVVPKDMAPPQRETHQHKNPQWNGNLWKKET